MVALVVMMIVIAIRGHRRRCRHILEHTDCAHIRGREGRRLAVRLSFYIDMLERLQSAGLPKPRWQPPAAYAQSLGRMHPAVSKIVNEITLAFYRIRFGGRSTDEAEALRMKEDLVRLDHALEESG